MSSPLTDYRVVERLVLGPRGGLTRVWKIETGPYHREVDSFSSRREALSALTRLVNDEYRTREDRFRERVAQAVVAVSPGHRTTTEGTTIAKGILVVALGGQVADEVWNDWTPAERAEAAAVAERFHPMIEQAADDLAAWLEAVSRRE